MDYRPLVDIARLVSASLIILFHTEGAPRKDLTISGLGYFLLLTFCLQAMTDTAGRPFSIGKRAGRLLVPWLAWSGLYAAIRVARRQSVLGDLLADPPLFLVGPELHLWFLPFAFLGGLASHVLLRWIARIPGRLAMVALGAASLLGGEAYLRLGEVAPTPWAQWLYALPLLPLGLAIGLAQRDRAELVPAYLFLHPIAALLAVRTGEPSYLIGATWLSLSILGRSPDIARLRRLAGLSLGLYLIHPCFIYVAHKLGVASNWVHVASITLIGSTLASAAISAIPGLNRLAFGVVAQTGPRPAKRPAWGWGRPSIFEVRGIKAAEADRIGL